MKTNRLFRSGLCLLTAGSFALLAVSALAGEPTKAVAVLHPTKGSNVEGIVTFTKSGDEMKIVADRHRSHAGQTWIPYSRVRRLFLAGRQSGRRPFQPDEQSARRP